MQVDKVLCRSLMIITLALVACSASAHQRNTRGSGDQNLAVAQSSPVSLAAVPLESGWFAHDHGLVVEPPRGRHQMAGVVWQIPAGGVAFLRGSGSPSGLDRQDGIALGRRADTLHFLHTFNPGPALEEWRLKSALQKRKVLPPLEPPVLFAYVVHYADGRTLEVPVRWGEGVQDWFRFGEMGPMPWAEVAWTQEVHPDVRVALYAMTWPNPRPEVEIASIDVVSGNTPTDDWGAPAVLGISTGDSGTPGNTYYVAMDGDDAGPGTFDEPWLTVQKAADTLQAGDTVYVRGGQYPITQPIIPANSGSEGAWITFSGYPGETPWIDGTSALLEGQHGLIQVIERSYIRLKNLGGRVSRNQGINVGRSKHVDILFCHTFMTRECGIGAWSACENVRMIGNSVIRPGRPEMSLNERGELVPTRKSGHEGLDIGRVFGFDVGYNDIIGSYKEGIDAKGPNRNGRIHHNYIAYSYGNGIYIDSWSDRMHHIQVDHNTLYMTDGIVIGSEPGTPVDHIDVHHNLVVDSWGSAIDVLQQHDGGRTLTSEIRVFNNTIHRTGGKYGSGPAVSVNGRRGADLRNVEVFNNISTAVSGPSYAVSVHDMDRQNVSFHHNLREPGAEGLRSEGDVQARMDYRNPAVGDFRPVEGSRAYRTAAPGSEHAYLGAFGPQAELERGVAMGGLVLSFYRGEPTTVPVTVPQDKFTNTVHQLTNRTWFRPPPAVKHEFSMFHLPTGRQHLGGVEWDIPDHYDHIERPTVCMLAGYGSNSPHGRIDGIPVGRKTPALHFLHTYNPAPELRALFGDMGWQKTGPEDPEPPVVFRYNIHYADGTTEAVAVRYQGEVGPWKAWEHARPLRNGRVAWKLQVGRRSLVEQQPAERFLMLWRPENRWVRAPGDLVLYSSSWQNPHPDKEIATIDIVSANTPEQDWGAAAVIAISARAE